MTMFFCKPEEQSVKMMLNKRINGMLILILILGFWYMPWYHIKAIHCFSSSSSNDRTIPQTGAVSGNRVHPQNKHAMRPGWNSFLTDHKSLNCLQLEQHNHPRQVL